MNNIYWVGTRQSDIEDTGDFFKGSVTIFGDNKNGNIAYCAGKNRINHNFDNKDCDTFFTKTLEKICENDDKACFIFYDQKKAYQFENFIKQRTICLNPFNTLEKFSNKQRSRLILNDIIESVPFVILNGAECNYKNIRNYFANDEEFVIQKTFSSGGEGTFHIDSNTIIDFVDQNEEYLISPYMKDAISLNTHVIISDNDILYFPSSVQIITEIKCKLLYFGADYICYNTFPQNIKAKINQKTRKIAKFVQQNGYRGVIGIDFLLKENQLFFMEFNTRFQASSHLINKSLYALYKTSLQEINLEAFKGDIITRIKPFDVNFSNYVYTTNNITESRLRRIALSKEVLQIQTDGYDACCSQLNEILKEENVYLNRFIFGRNICSINNQNIILHPNIYVENIKPLLSVSNPSYKEYIKIALMNHGITLDESAIQLAKKIGTIKEAVFDAIDVVIFEKVYVNIPNSCKFNTLSPFTIEAINDKFVLFFDGNKITDVDICFVPNSLLNKYTESGVPYDSIINISTDRIRINPAPVCYYKQHGVQCKFCNLPNYNTPYNISDIKEVIDYCLVNVDFRHFLIGGGTYSVDDDSWNIVSEIAKYIRKKSDKNIYLMSIPPEKNIILDELKKSGVTEVAFNLEMFDRRIAKEYMPGKGNIDLSQYISALRYSVSLWGNTGCVRSLLIYGFDSEKCFLNGINMLCEMGVEPIISIFRPLKGTEFSELNPPPTLDIISIYNKCKKIALMNSMILGPNCPMCQNNTLSYT